MKLKYQFCASFILVIWGQITFFSKFGRTPGDVCIIVSFIYLFVYCFHHVGTQVKLECDHITFLYKKAAINTNLQQDTPSGTDRGVCHLRSSNVGIGS